MPPPPTPDPAPPGWPRTDRPISVAILGWARLSLQAREGSGYNLSASELAAGLALCGHRVSYLASGIRYSPRPGIRTRPLETWRGVECFEVVNSPCASPAACNFTNTQREMRSPRLTLAVLRWLDARGAQVVHIHSLEGCSLDLVAAVRATGRPVVVTPHNYWYVCPQVDLLHKEARLCDDYRGGERCVGCLIGRPFGAQRAGRTVGQAMERAIGPGLTDLVRKTGYSVVKALWPVKRGTSSPRKPTPAPAWTDPDLARGFDAGPPGDGRIERGLSPDPADPADKVIDPPPLAEDENERFLTSDRHLVVLNDYGRRRAAGISALNAASLVTPPSDFLRRVHVAMGVEEARTRTVRLGQPHFDQIHRRAARSPYYDSRPWDPSAPRPLRFGFFGTTRPNKGLEVLIRAILTLDPAVRQRCQFLIRAAGWDWPFRKRVAAFPEVQFAGGYDLIQLIGAGGEYDVGVVPHIWFENSPLVLLEHLHAGKFVLAARLGGPVEWVVEPSPAAAGNGLFFPAGQPERLAACISRLVRGEVVLPSPREVHARTPHLQTYPGHVAEVEGIYNELLRREGGPRAAATGARETQGDHAHPMARRREGDGVMGEPVRG